MNNTETQFLLLTMSHIEYKIGKILSDSLNNCWRTYVLCEATDTPVLHFLPRDQDKVMA